MPCSLLGLPLFHSGQFSGDPSRLLYVAHSFLLLSSRLWCGSMRFVKPFIVEGHLDCFQLGAVTKSVDKNSHVCVFRYIHMCITTIVCIPKSGIAGYV